VVLGGGMLRGGRGLLFDSTVELLAERAPRARPVTPVDAPVLGSALVALHAAGAPAAAAERLRAAVRAGVRVETVGG
jgi:hypothetical protein